ncbi:extracellular solute-binding protein [Cohnella silvisoli]|uniref:Extracellular solute-binding protein n=1 Tax=Cohnella silvisoli TaxID=2873699 RepID=A0ABV1KTY6_9BACL|nr:extracellular solute-binding protein [Cohnella silvisoli]MCD9022699.1 extracellular solute-binding protein [Cohnella silvisoli]
MRKSGGQKLLFASLCLCLIITVAACSSGDNSAKESDSAISSESKASNAEGTAQASAPSNADADSKYDPPVEITAVRGINGNYKFNEGESYDNNVWTQAYEQELGIKLKYKWYVDNTQYEQKIGLDIASNDLPDLFSVNSKDFNNLAENGMIADLTEAYNQYASPLLRSVLESDLKSFEALHYNGKLMAIGQPGNLGEQVNVIWIRKDWLDNVGLSAPKTMDDVLQIADAFTTKDPDRNGKNDTFGLALTNQLFGGGFADLAGFAYGYHAYPNIWIKDGSGKIVYGNVQPEMKTVLEKLQNMYKQGLIDPEFGVKDGGKLAEMTTAGKIGMEYGAFWNPGWPLGDSKKADPKAEWMPYTIVSVDGNPAVGAATVGISGFIVANNKFSNPEALIKLANFTLEKGYGKSAETEFSKFMMSEDGKQLFDLAFMTMAPTSKNIDIMHKVSEAVAKKDGAGLRGEEKSTFESAMRWLEHKDPANWVHYNVFGSGDQSAMALIEGYSKNNQIKVNEFYGSPTPTMVDKQATLAKLESEVFTKIIMGGSLNEFDDFVNQWHKLGGDEMTNEVNELSQRN